MSIILTLFPQVLKQILLPCIPTYIKQTLTIILTIKNIWYQLREFYEPISNQTNVTLFILLKLIFKV